MPQRLKEIYETLEEELLVVEARKVRVEAPLLHGQTICIEVAIKTWTESRSSRPMHSRAPRHMAINLSNVGLTTVSGVLLPTGCRTFVM